MIIIALAFALQAAAPEAPEPLGLSAAFRAWDDCLDAAARRYGLSVGSAGELAKNSLDHCQVQDRAFLAAGVEAALAASPGLSREEAAERALAQRRSRLRMKAWEIAESAELAQRRQARTVGERAPSL